MEQLGGTVLPGWETMSGLAISRIPSIGGEGLPLHPDRTYQLAATREAVAQRVGTVDRAELPRLDALYDRIRVVKVTSSHCYDRPVEARGTLGGMS